MQIVLVHGGWQGGWCWDHVADRLRAAGHDVFAPTLQGMSEDDDRRGVTLTSMSADLISRIEAQDWPRFALVGHSGGGPLIQLVAEAMPDRVSSTVFVDAWVLQNGESINDLLPAALVDFAEGAAAASSDRSVHIPPEMFVAAFMQDAPEAVAAEVTPRLVATPMGWLDERVTLSTFWKLGIPSAYVFLDDDQAVPRDTYQEAAARLTDPLLANSPGSHEAMITRPEELTSALLRVIR